MKKPQVEKIKEIDLYVTDLNKIKEYTEKTNEEFKESVKRLKQLKY